MIIIFAIFEAFLLDMVFIRFSIIPCCKRKFLSGVDVQWGDVLGRNSVSFLYEGGFWASASWVCDGGAWVLKSFYPIINLLSHQWKKKISLNCLCRLVGKNNKIQDITQVAFFEGSPPSSELANRRQILTNSLIVENKGNKCHQILLFVLLLKPNFLSTGYSEIR